jgi:hypothetical protein
MSIYAREDFVLRYIWLNVIFKRMLLGQPPVYTGLCSNGMQFCLLISRFHVEFADGCACVWRGWLELFIPKTSFNVTVMMVVVSWFGIKSIIMTKQASSKWMQIQIHSLNVRESWFLKFCHFGTRVKLLYFNNVTLDRTPHDRPKKFYGRAISLYWNDQQVRLIYHQLSMCRSFLINV